MKKLFLLFALVFSASLFISCAATVREYSPSRPDWIEKLAFKTIELGPQGKVIFAVGESEGKDTPQVRAAAEAAAIEKIARYLGKKDVGDAKTKRFWCDGITAYALVATHCP